MRANTYNRGLDTNNGRRRFRLVALALGFCIPLAIGAGLGATTITAPGCAGIGSDQWNKDVALLEAHFHDFETHLGDAYADVPAVQSFIAAIVQRNWVSAALAIPGVVAAVSENIVLIADVRVLIADLGRLVKDASGQASLADGEVRLAIAAQRLQSRVR